MSKSDPKHFMTIDGHKFRKNHVRWALRILNADPDYCPKTQATLAIIGGFGRAEFFVRPFLNEAEHDRKYTKKKNEFLTLFNVLKDRRRKKSERLKSKHRTDQDDAR